MLTAPLSRIRDWTLFAAAALAPALAVGVLGLRALSNEEAGARREVALALDATAERTSRDIERAVASTTLALTAATFDADLATTSAALRSIAPPFAESVFLGSDRALLVPAANAPTELPPRRCSSVATSIASTTDTQERRDSRQFFIASCRESKTASGRWLWPIVALDGLGRHEADAEPVAVWFEAHAGRLSAPERDAALIDVEASHMLDASQRQRVMSALSSNGSRRDELLAELRSEGATLAIDGLDSSTEVAWRAGRSEGRLHILRDGRFAGFIVYAGALRDALAAGTLAIPSDVRAEVIAGAPPPERGRAAFADGLVAFVEVAPELVIRLSPADPKAVARSASKSRAALLAVAIGTTALAFAFASVLFARMRAAKRSSELRTDFVSAVSHELRTPIASVRMLAELLEENRVEPDEHDEVYRAIARESRRLGETVDRLLGFSRMEAGRYVLDRQRTALAGPVGASIDTFEERHPDAPRIERALDADVFAELDAGQVRLAVDNLLANAKKYAPEGAPYRVVVTAERDRAVVRVVDGGPGIAKRDQARIFRPFERADDRLSRATEGSGIGLSLVRHVARAHSGDASVESEPGRGATFTMWIPRSRT